MYKRQILNRAVDRPLLYHVFICRCYSQNDLLALLHLNTGFGGGVDGLKCVAVAGLSGQRAIFAADRFQRNKLACRKVCCNFVTLGYIVQRQRQTAVALVLRTVKQRTACFRFAVRCRFPWTIMLFCF